MKRPRLAAFDRNCFGDETVGIIGVDEAGRGAFAGPVVAAALWMDRSFYGSSACRRIQPFMRDSKALTLEKREDAFRRLERCRDRGEIGFAYGIGSVEEIAEENILGATRLAMKRALDTILEERGCPRHSWQEIDENDFFFCPRQAADIQKRPVILIDGNRLNPFFYPHRPLVKGDSRSLAIAAASIVAKVTRDRLMEKYHEEFPAYGFDRNRGYGTAAHIQAIHEHGILEIHREKFLEKLVAAGLGQVDGPEFNFKSL
ncbi:MAG TPA: ribonuclease HII [Opitutales bacterium]|nr:ribonuclease HII [Opitutales bacterium]